MQVVIYNMYAEISPIRHVISCDARDKIDFEDWYYSEFHKLEGDSFYWAEDMNEAKQFIKTIEEKYWGEK